MAYTVTVKTRNVDVQIKNLRRFEAFAEAHYKTALRSVITPTKAAVKANAPVFSGDLRKEITSKVSGVGANVSGAVMNGFNTWYGNVVEYGRHTTKKMPPVSVIAEKYSVPMNEAFLIARAIAAPEAKARKPANFFGKVRENAFRLAEVALSAANEKIVEEMKV